MSITATLYTRPHGHKTSFELTSILPGDERYIRAKGITIGLEFISDNIIAMYFITTIPDGDGGTLEFTLLALPGEDSCADTIHMGVLKCKELYGEEK
jgi:hypothetical protein